MRLSSRTRRRILISLTPMIDVVFIMLIFYMVAGRPTLPDPFEIDPPLSASEGLLDPQELLVVVGADGRLALDGTVMPDDSLKSSVVERLSVNESLEVRLKADAQVQATRVITVMELLRDAGVEQLKLLTVPASN